MTWYYPISLLESFFWLIFGWLMFHLLALCSSKCENLLKPVQQWRREWRAYSSRVMLIFLRKEPLEKKNGIWKHSHEHVWGIQFSALILLPSVTAFLGKNIFFMAGKYFWGKIIPVSILSFTVFFLTIFAVIPTKEEIFSLMQTTSSSRWKWGIKGIVFGSLIYSSRFIFSIDPVLLYVLVCLCLFCPLSEKLIIQNENHISHISKLEKRSA